MHVQVMEERIPVAEYFQRDNAHDFKLELINGRIFAMAGANLLHNRIVRRIDSVISAELDPVGCETFILDLRVEVDSWHTYTYPDVVVVCDEPRVNPAASPDTLLNPTLIFEVLSPSTEFRDRNDKYDLYLRLPSLQGYFMVSQFEPRIECVQRDGSDWIQSEHIGLDAALVINSPACELPLRQIYRHLAQ